MKEYIEELREHCREKVEKAKAMIAYYQNNIEKYSRIFNATNLTENNK